MTRKLHNPYQQEMLNKMVQYVISNASLFRVKGDGAPMIPFMGDLLVEDPASNTTHSKSHNSMVMVFTDDINSILEAARMFAPPGKILERFFTNIVYFAAVKELDIVDAETLLLMTQDYQILK